MAQRQAKIVRERQEELAGQFVDGLVRDTAGSPEILLFAAEMFLNAAKSRGQLPYPNAQARQSLGRQLQTFAARLNEFTPRGFRAAEAQVLAIVASKLLQAVEFKMTAATRDLGGEAAELDWRRIFWQMHHAVGVGF